MASEPRTVDARLEPVEQDLLELVERIERLAAPPPPTSAPAPRRLVLVDAVQKRAA